MKSPHAALTEAAAIQLQVSEADTSDQRFITLGYHCADWGFLVKRGVMAEVLPLPRLNSVPRSPGYCWGICNIRGNIVPVFDLSEFLNGKSDYESRDKLYVLLQGGVSEQVGIVINNIPKSLQFTGQQQLNQSSHLPDKLVPYIQGVYRQDDDIWHEIDIEGLLKAG